MIYKLKVNLLAKAFAVASKIFGVGFPPAPSVSAIIKRNSKIMVVDLSYKEGYALPGGVLKGHEDFLEALKREVKEETNLKVKNCRYFNTYSSTADIGGFPKVNVTYLAEVEGKIINSQEGKVEWKEPNKIINKLPYEDNKQAVTDFIKRK